MRTQPGFSSLSAAALLLLIAALASLAVASAGDSSQAEARARKTLERQGTVWALAQESLEAFRQRWRPANQEWIAFAREQRLSRPVEFEDLSSRINLNSVNTFLLTDSRLSETLGDRGAVAFQDQRVKRGPFASPDDYAEYFTKDSLANLYTTWSILDVNTVDEEVAERIATLRTGDPGVGAAIRGLLRTARETGSVFTGDQWADRVAGLSPHLVGVFGVEPELNVNTASPDLLEALLTYPAFALASAPSKLALLVSGRKERPWTPESLAATLGVEKGARILQYLGTESRFLQGQVREDGRIFQFVVQRVDGSSDTAGFRIVSQGWLP